MKMGVYAIYDIKADAFMTPLFMVNDDVAIRNFVTACINPESMFYMHAQDFVLYHSDDWDDGKGRFVGDGHKREIGNGLDLMQRFIEQLERTQKVQEKIGKLTEGSRMPGSNGEDLNA